MSPTQHPPLTVQIIREVEAWDAIEHHWERLHDATPWASTSLDFRWLRTWWRFYGPIYGGGRDRPLTLTLSPSGGEGIRSPSPRLRGEGWGEGPGLRIVTVWRGTRLVGAAPLYLSSGLRALRMLSTGEAEYEETCADYLDLLSAPDDAAGCARLIWDEVRRMRWDCLELLDISNDSPLVAASGASSGPNATITSNASGADAHQWFERGSCPIADLSGGFESYLQKLSSNTRQQVRRLMRAGERAGARFELATAAQIDQVFDELIALHQRDWTTRGQPGVFAAPRFVEFHRSLLHDWLPCGRAVLARLSVGESPVVVLHGYLTRGKFDFYQSGMTRERIESLASPGILAHVLLMRELAASSRGVEAYDFLRGQSDYKQRLSTTSKPLVGLRIWRPTFTAMRHRLSGWLQNGLRNARVRVRGDEGRAAYADREAGRATP